MKEPPIVTANTVLSILAVDYPVDGLGSSAVAVLLYSVQYFENQPFKTIERTSFLSSVNT
jgi:hypothetical protein